MMMEFWLCLIFQSLCSVFFPCYMHYQSTYRQPKSPNISNCRAWTVRVIYSLYSLSFPPPPIKRRANSSILSTIQRILFIGTYSQESVNRLSIQEKDICNDFMEWETWLCEDETWMCGTWIKRIVYFSPLSAKSYNYQLLVPKVVSYKTYFGSTRVSMLLKMLVGRLDLPDSARNHPPV